jgi:hypothetical protein
MPAIAKRHPVLLIILGLWLLATSTAAADPTAVDAVTSPDLAASAAPLADAAAQAPEAIVAGAAIADALAGVPTADPGVAVQGLMTAAQSGETMAIISALIFLLLSLLRVPAVRVWVTRIMPMRWVSVVAVALGCMWMVLIQAPTMGLWAAVVNGFLAGGGAVALYEVTIRAVMGKDVKEDAALKTAYAAALERGDLEPLRELADK